jgi:tryptophan synthase alpha chain
MNRLEQHFTELKNEYKKALILFVTAGDPTLEKTLSIMEAMALNGVDCIELGVPFSDPIADGPVIQRSTARALKNKINLGDILNLIKSFRQKYNTPIVCMGYLNPIIRYGEEKFITDLNSAGGDALIIADLPYEEGENFELLCKSNNVNLVYLLAPEIGTNRTANILKASSGFVYCVSHYGTTGVGGPINSGIKEVTASLKKLTALPLAIGFGISNEKSAKEMSNYADGIIIGSWLIKELENAANKAKAAGEFTQMLKSAIM